MRILIVGGTGRIGRLVIDEALAKGHSLTALVRDSSSSALPAREGLTLVTGSPLSAADVARAFAAGATPVDAVLVTLRLATTSDSPMAGLLPDTPPHLGADSVRNLLAAMQSGTGAGTGSGSGSSSSTAAAAAVRKLVVLNAQGTGSSLAGATHLHRAMFHLLGGLRRQLEDHNAVDALVRAAAAERPGELDFVLARPVMVVDGDAAPVRDWGDDGRGSGLLPRITGRSVARFMVEAAEGDEFNGRSPVITN